MSLQLSITLAESTDCTTISVTDTSGTYNGTTNTVGYGAGQSPAGERTIAKIFEAYLRIVLPKQDLADYIQTVLSSGDAQTIAGGTAYSSSMANMGGTTGEEIPDGVYFYELIQVFQGQVGTSIDVTDESNTITCTDAAQFTGAKYVVIDAGSSTRQILEIANIVGTTITTVEDYSGTTQTLSDTNYAIGYSATKYIGAKGLINNCLHEKIADMAVEDCGCKNKTRETLKESVVLFFSIQSNMDRVKYNKAQTVIDTLTLRCSSDCGCS